jgi:hypothetical protein
MFIAYLSLDPVNQDLADCFAALAGAQLRFLTFSDPPGPSEGVVYDYDFLPPDYRGGLVAGLLLRRPSTPVAIHGYGLPAGDRRALRRQGVAVTQRLGPELFARLQREAVASLPQRLPARLNSRRSDRVPLCA